MIGEVILISTHLKMFASCMLITALVLADMGVTPQSAEDYTLKGLLICALLYVSRLLLIQQDAHKADMKEIAKLHKEDCVQRENKLQSCIEAQTHSMSELTTLTREQTDYFKTVTRNIVDDRLNSKPKLPL